MSESKNTRRQFLTTAAGLAAVSTAGVSAARPASAAPRPAPHPSPQRGRVIGANDRINIGMIGVGGRGSSHVRTLNSRIEMKGDVRIVAISDIYSKRIEAGRQNTRVEEKDVHRDYHDLLARSDVDGVFISTPDHWHAPMTIDAFEAGKDVYLEKPMTLTIDEAREVTRKAQQTGRVLQVGCQHTSDLSNHKARQIVEEGLIGEVLWAQSTYSRNSVHGEWNYRIDEGATAEDIGWEQFLGPAPKRPFDPDRYFRWRKYWDYSGGIATDLFYHRLSPLRQIMGIEFPLRVTGNGGIYVHKDREVPDTYTSTIEYANDYVVLGSSMANSAGNQHMQPVIYGHKGTITFDDGVVIVEPEWQFLDGFSEKTHAAKMYYEVEPHNANEEHIYNFLECMRTRQMPHCGIDLSYKVMTAIKLGVDSYREGKMMLWDAERERRVDQAPARKEYPGDGKNHEEPRRQGRFGG
jgi:predicted dehydrogenase